MTTITVEWMKANGGVPSEIKDFRSMFGESAPLTRETILRASSRINIGDWLAARLLEEPARADYHVNRDRAYKRYLAATAWQRTHSGPSLLSSSLVTFNRKTTRQSAAFEAARANALADALGLS
jgi:hypothetical protein